MGCSVLWKFSSPGKDVHAIRRREREKEGEGVTGGAR